MTRWTQVSRRQLALFLEPEIKHPLPEEAHEALVAILAELLLEALGTHCHEPRNVQGDVNEPEDYI